MTSIKTAEKNGEKKSQYLDSSGIAGYAAIITAASFWGASGVFVKLITANEAVSATALAFWRDFATFICLLFVGLVTNPTKIRIKRSDWRYIAGMGASLGLFHIFYNLSVILNGSAVTTVQQALMPAIVRVAVWYLWQEAFTGRKILAILLMSEIAFAVFYAYLLLNERLTLTQIAGSTLVVIGVLQLLRKN